MSDDRTEVVYFIRRKSDGLVKIGTTTNLRWRVNALRQGWDSEVEILGVCSGGVQLEATIHRYFRKRRMGRTELFQESKGMRLFIQQHTYIPESAAYYMPKFPNEINECGWHRCMFCGVFKPESDYPIAVRGRRRQLRRCKNCISPKKSSPDDQPQDA
jgi:hypothetical protein